MFEMRCHLYQGRNLIGLGKVGCKWDLGGLVFNFLFSSPSDSTGLSDPYAKVTIRNQSVYSRIINQTNNPKWNNTLKIRDIYLYASYEEIVQNPPEIILELYDEDKFTVIGFFASFLSTPLTLSRHSQMSLWENVSFGLLSNAAIRIRPS